jgi:hypothetical protein
MISSETLIWGAVILGVSIVFGWLVPALAMPRLLPVLEKSSHQVTNYRGRRIPTGLGLVWVVWGVGFAVAGAVATTIANLMLTRPGVELFTLVPAFFNSIPILLVVGAAIFGLVDDLFGDASAKGFRGHLAALSRGRLTTGALKLIGIGGLSLVAAARVASTHAYDLSGPIEPSILNVVATWVLAAMVIALSANFVNLTDLRPGRALKAYSLLALIGLAGIAWVLLAKVDAGQVLLLPGDPGWAGTFLFALAAVVFGPVAAIWRMDLGERAMLGDAGANAAGALAGYLLVVFAPLWFMAVCAAVLFALNLASERYSFTKVIDRVPLLTWFDGLGRLPLVPDSGMTDECDEGVRAGGPADQGDDA